MDRHSHICVNHSIAKTSLSARHYRMDAARSTSNEWLLPIEFIQVVLDIDNTTYENLVRDVFQYFVFPHLRSEESSQQFDTLFPILSIDRVVIRSEPQKPILRRKINVALHIMSI